MRSSKTKNGFKVNAISGTNVVVLAFDLPQSKCKDLLGFSIHRVDETENEAYYLKASKTFPETDPGFPDGSLYSTKHHPIQSFQWADYSAKPDHSYTYTVTALKGKPSELVDAYTTQIKIDTESHTNSKHSIYFNRGIAASQEYVRRFGDRSPDDVPNNKAYEWLSRGTYEALEEFISSCKPGRHSLRIAAYELNYKPFLELLESTKNKGVDLEIIYDARRDSPRISNIKNINRYNLSDVATKRKTNKSYISHNKFIIKLDDGEPSEVWTGGMNFSKGGIFGQSNVVHVFRDTELATDFLKYWEILKKDKGSKDTKNLIESFNLTPSEPLSKANISVFSPRKSLDVLELYKSVAMQAQKGFFMTFAFGINNLFKEAYRNSNAQFRFALLEKKTRPMKKAERLVEEAIIQKLRNDKRNLFSVGSYIKTNKLDGWVRERLSGFNKYVNFIHNKFMLVDPLTNNPIVITGSANFSNASTIRNDENMVIIHGNKSVADIYLGEFFRLYSHHAFRESYKWRRNARPKDLRTDDWWKDYYGDTQRSHKREYFADISI